MASTITEPDFVLCLPKQRPADTTFRGDKDWRPAITSAHYQDLHATHSHRCDRRQISACARIECDKQRMKTMSGVAKDDLGVADLGESCSEDRSRLRSGRASDFRPTVCATVTCVKVLKLIVFRFNHNFSGPFCDRHGGH